MTLVTLKAIRETSCGYIYLQKSDVIHPNNSNCKKCSDHLSTRSKMKDPYFNIYLFLHEVNKYLRELKERRYVMS